MHVNFARKGTVPLKLWILYLIGMNIYTFALMGYDKGRARRQERRVPEKRLFGSSALGGALGAWIGMWTWRHKTKHPSFVIGIPALLVLNGITAYLVWKGISYVTG